MPEQVLVPGNLSDDPVEGCFLGAGLWSGIIRSAAAFVRENCEARLVPSSDLFTRLTS